MMGRHFEGGGGLLTIIKKVAVRIREKLEGDKYTTAKINITFYAFTSGSALILYSGAILQTIYRPKVNKLIKIWPAYSKFVLPNDSHHSICFSPI